MSCVCARVPSVWRRRLLAREIPIVSEMDWFCCMVDDLLRHQVRTRARAHASICTCTHTQSASVELCVHARTHVHTDSHQAQARARALADAHSTPLSCRQKRQIQTAAQSASVLSMRKLFSSMALYNNLQNRTDAPGGAALRAHRRRLLPDRRRRGGGLHGLGHDPVPARRRRPHQGGARRLPWWTGGFH